MAGVELEVYRGAADHTAESISLATISPAGEWAGDEEKEEGDGGGGSWQCQSAESTHSLQSTSPGWEGRETPSSVIVWPPRYGEEPGDAAESEIVRRHMVPPITPVWLQWI